MNLNDLQTDLNASLKAGKSVRVGTLRFLISAIRNLGIAKYGAPWETSLTEADVAEVVKKQIKTHKESVEAFENANRVELVEKERAELAILEEFAPKEMSDEELKKILEPIARSGEPNFGLLMKQAMTAVASAGQADGGRVSMILKQISEHRTQ